MANFYLIDHSLTTNNGERYEEAAEVLRAAQAAGYGAVLTTNRRCRPNAPTGDPQRIRPLFRHEPLSRFSVAGGWRGGALDLQGRVMRTGRRSWLPRAGWWSQGERRHRIQLFASACRQLFDDVPLSCRDHVLFTALTEFDLLGLASFLASDPQTLVANWHLRFPFDVFDHRAPAMQPQQLTRVLRRQFESALSHVLDHGIQFYTTTEQLVRQYNNLDMAAFRVLPCPKICGEWPEASRAEATLRTILSTSPRDKGRLPKRAA